MPSRQYIDIISRSLSWGLNIPCIKPSEEKRGGVFAINVWGRRPSFERNRLDCP